MGQAHARARACVRRSQGKGSYDPDLLALPSVRDGNDGSACIGPYPTALVDPIPHPYGG